MQRIAAVFCDQDRIFRVGEGDIINRRMVGVAQVDKRNVPSITARVEIDTENSTPGAARCQLRLYAGTIICVASDVEEESLKVRIRLELPILRALEWRGACSLGASISIERPCTIYSRVVNRDPLDWVY